MQRNVFKDGARPEHRPARRVATGTVADNWVTTDDLRFVNQADGDLTLSPDSPVFTKVPGFEALPFERMRKSTQEPLEIGLRAGRAPGIRAPCRCTAAPAPTRSSPTGRS